MESQTGLADQTHNRGSMHGSARTDRRRNLPTYLLYQKPEVSCDEYLSLEVKTSTNRQTYVLFLVVCRLNVTIYSYQTVNLMKSAPADGRTNERRVVDVRYRLIVSAHNLNQTQSQFLHSIVLPQFHLLTYLHLPLNDRFQTICLSDIRRLSSESN